MSTFSPEPDLDLLARFRGGEPDAFGQIVQRYGGMVFSCCLRVTGDRHRAEDLAQETFFRLSQQPDAVARSLPAWLHKVATRLSIDALRRADARRRHEHGAAREAALAGQAVHDGGAASWAEVGPELDRALDALPEPSRAVLVRHFLMGVPQRTLAGELGMSQATVSRRVNLALGQLRKRLGKRGLIVGAAAALGAMLAQAPAHAAPAGLAQSAGGMSLVHALAPASAQPAPAPLALKAAAVGVPLAAAAVVGVALLVQWAAIRPSPPTRAQVQQLASPAPGSQTRAGHEEMETASDTTAHARSAVGTLIVLPGHDTHDFASTHLIAIERPAGDPDATVQAVYADGHVATLTERDARAAVLAQTGRTLDDLADHPTTPTGGNHHDGP